MAENNKDRELSALDPVDELKPDDLMPISHEGEAGKNITVEDFMAAAGLDYSSLEEQIVPGRKVMCPDGVARQAYVRSYVGTTLGSGTLILGNNIVFAQLIAGGVCSADNVTRPPFWIAAGQDIDGFLWRCHTKKESLLIDFLGTGVQYCPYAVTFLYAKNE